MAIDLTKLLSTGEAQQQLQNSYSDYLKQKRELQGVRDTAEQRFTGSFGPQGETGAIVNPADIFSSFRTFQSAVPSQAESLATESSILDQIAKLAQAQKPEVKQPTITEQIAARKEGYNIVTDPTTGMLTLESASGENQKITPEKEAELLKLRESRIGAGLDTKDIDEKLGLTGKIGEDEVKGVSLIDDILNTSDQALRGSTGVFKAGKILSPYQTPTLRNKLKQLTSILQLASAGKLKGSGAVSDAERQLLANAVTSLGLNEKGITDLQPQEVKAQLEELRVALSKKSNDPNLINKYVVETTSNPQAGPMPTVGGYVIEEIK